MGRSKRLNHLSTTALAERKASVHRAEVEEAAVDRRMKEAAKTPEGRLCPVCLNEDALDSEGNLLGICCENGHGICVPCAKTLVALCPCRKPACGFRYTCPVGCGSTPKLGDEHLLVLIKGKW